jgi:uncharacterized membrane protein YdcZ (DUF606 family)
MFLDSVAVVGVLVFLTAFVIAFRRNRKKLSFMAAFPTHTAYGGVIGALWLFDSYGRALWLALSAA